MSAQKSKPVTVLGAFLGLVGFSTLAGLLVAAMVTPALAVTSMTASNTVGIFEDLPDAITINQQSQRNTLWATQGGQAVPFAQVFDQNREEVTWDNVSQFVKDATVAGEDARFYQHGGVDLAGIARAVVNNATSESTQGASTLDQQLVKNLLIQNAVATLTGEELAAAKAEAQATTLVRKLKEAKLAIGLEKKYTKREILLGYLNIAGFGGNTYGIESAAQQYYSTHAKDLTLAQAASLIAIVQLPESRRPDNPDNWERNQSRRDAILGNMLRYKMITQAQHDEAVATPVDDTTVIVSSPKNGCLYASAAKQFCDYVVRNVGNLEALGSTPEDRLAAWKTGGYDIYTTLDLDQNAVAEQTIATYAPATEERFQLGSAVSSIQVGTGRIVVMAQNKTFDNRSIESGGGGPTTTSLNFNTDYDAGGSNGFQVGSTYKLFTLVAWLQDGRGLNEIVNGSPAKYTLPAKCGGTVPWDFKNDGNSNPGRVSILRATSGSINAAFAAMANKLDVCEIRDVAKSMGVHRADGAELGTNSTMILGTDEIAPLTMANAYATVASAGVLCQPIAVDKVVAPDGTELVGQDAKCAQAIAPEVAAAAATALKTVMNGGTGSSANPRDGTPLIGKTGTADALSTFLAVSSTKVASAVWVGNISGQQDLRKISVGGRNAGQLRFAIAKPIVASLNASPAGVGAADFPPPPRSLLIGKSQTVPNVIGQSVASAKKLIESLGLDFIDAGSAPSDAPVGRIIGSSPGSGAVVSRGAAVRVTTSDGTLSTTMPNVAGKQLAAAKEELSAAGFDLGKVTVKYTASDPAKACTVTGSNPAGGSATSKASGVSLTVDGGELVPGVDPEC